MMQVLFPFFICENKVFLLKWWLLKPYFEKGVCKSQLCLLGGRLFVKIHWPCLSPPSTQVALSVGLLRCLVTWITEILVECLTWKSNRTEVSLCKTQLSRASSLLNKTFPGFMKGKALWLFCPQLVGAVAWELVKRTGSDVALSVTSYKLR